MKGYAKKIFTPEEIEKVKNVISHYSYLRNNYKEEDYQMEVLHKTWYGKIRIKKRLDTAKIDELFNGWMHWADYWDSPGIWKSKYWDALLVLNTLLKSSSEVYLSEDLSAVWLKVQKEEL